MVQALLDIWQLDFREIIKDGSEGIFSDVFLKFPKKSLKFDIIL